MSFCIYTHWSSLCKYHTFKRDIFFSFDKIMQRLNVTGHYIIYTAFFALLINKSDNMDPACFHLITFDNCYIKAFWYLFFFNVYTTDIVHDRYEIITHELMQRVSQFIQIPTLISVKHSKSIKKITCFDVYLACKLDLVVDQRLTFNKIIENILSMEINVLVHRTYTQIPNLYCKRMQW